MFVVGKKCDLESERVIRNDEGKQFARQLGIPSLETSAKQRLNVDEAFMALVREVRKSKPSAAVGKEKQGGKKKGCNLL